MKIQLENDDIQLIASELLRSIKPLLQKNTRKADKESVFDPDDLAEYLNIDKDWIYKQVQLHTIPFFKIGKYLRFKKTAIDKWIEENSRQPMSPLQLPNKR